MDRNEDDRNGGSGSVPDVLEAGIDRDRGILTKSDRECLLGLRDLEGQDERNARYRIRHRVAQSLFDVQLLAYYLQYRDIEQVLSDENLPDDLWGELLTFAFRFGDCLSGPAGFTYEDRSEETEAERYIEERIRLALNHAIWANSQLYQVGKDRTDDLGENMGYNVEVEVDLSIDRALHDIDEIFEKLKEGTATQEEFSTWIKQGDPEKLREYKENNTDPLRYKHPDLEKTVMIDVSVEDLHQHGGSENGG